MHKPLWGARSILGGAVMVLAQPRESRGSGTAPRTGAESIDGGSVAAEGYPPASPARRDITSSECAVGVRAARIALGRSGREDGLGVLGERADVRPSVGLHPAGGSLRTTSCSRQPSARRYANPSTESSAAGLPTFGWR